MHQVSFHVKIGVRCACGLCREDILRTVFREQRGLIENAFYAVYIEITFCDLLYRVHIVHNLYREHCDLFREYIYAVYIENTFYVVLQRQVACRHNYVLLLQFYRFTTALCCICNTFILDKTIRSRVNIFSLDCILSFEMCYHVEYFFAVYINTQYFIFYQTNALKR